VFLNKRIVACDADGVIIDIHSEFLVFANQKLDTNFRLDDWTIFDFAELAGLSKAKTTGLWDAFYGSVKLTLLPAVVGAIEVLNRLQSKGVADPTVITSRPDHIVTPTIEWFAVNVPNVPIHFSIGANNAYAGGPGRKSKLEIAEEIDAFCLLDDNPHEFTNCSSKVIPIVFARPWNERDIPEGVKRMNWFEFEEFLQGPT